MNSVRIKSKIRADVSTCPSFTFLIHWVSTESRKGETMFYRSRNYAILGTCISFFFRGKSFFRFCRKKAVHVYLFFLQTVSVLPMSRDARASAPVRSSLTGDVLVGRVCFSGKNMSALSPKNTVPFISEKSKRT